MMQVVQIGWLTLVNCRIFIITEAKYRLFNQQSVVVTGLVFRLRFTSEHNGHPTATSMLWLAAMQLVVVKSARLFPVDGSAIQPWTRRIAVNNASILLIRKWAMPCTLPEPLLNTRNPEMVATSDRLTIWSGVEGRLP
ncbi:hypothetical protein T4E_7918 [Trichinella pseudospiralis]|uniref:Uncharacterized protein n=1 Tax=Trichinella pseudospiralis TaxID=6337 RepID=A0A0V0YGV6_TRIPS|nr:hypothetical protein T4E_7918 [Trichinella pseudospiralis]